MPSNIRRRSLLRASIATASAIAIAPLLQACQSSTTPQSSTSQPAGTSSGVRLPAYAPIANLPKPDLPAIPDRGVPPVYFRYPKDNLVSVVPSPPGSGGAVTTLTLSLTPPPAPLEQNVAWQTLNKQLNADVKFTFVGSTNDYFARFATIMAGSPSAYPDLLWVRDILYVQGVNDFLKSAYADLGPYLGGDAVKQFPCLAAIPAFAWQNSVRNRTISGIPNKPSTGGSDGAFNLSIWKDGSPKNSDDFIRMAKNVNRPRDGIYALVDSLVLSGKSPGLRSFFLGMFGAPNEWRVTNGKLVKDIETDEYKAAVEYCASLYSAGLVHPDAASLSAAQIRNLQTSGKCGFSAEFSRISYGILWSENAGRQRFQLAAPFAHDGKAVPAYHYGLGSTGIIAVKKGSDARIRELVGILNFLSAPFGSTQNHLLVNGVEGVDYNYDAGGNPRLTQRGSADMQMERFMGPESPIYNAVDPAAFGDQVGKYVQEVAKIGVFDPTIGFSSNTFAASGASLNQMITDRLRSIVSGRSPMSAFDELIRDWRSKGGDAMRAEYERQL